MTSTDLVWGSESLSSESEVLALSLKWPDTESHDPDLFTPCAIGFFNICAANSDTHTHINDDPMATWTKKFIPNDKPPTGWAPR